MAKRPTEGNGTVCGPHIKPFGVPELKARVRALLHRKLEDDPARPRHLLTESGVGYRLVE